MHVLHPWGPGGVRNEEPQMAPFRSSGMKQRATPKLLMKAHLTFLCSQGKEELGCGPDIAQRLRKNQNFAENSSR